MMMKPMVQSQTLIRPARSASCFPWQAREAAAAAKTPQGSSYIVLATPLKSRLASQVTTSHGAHGP